MKKYLVICTNEDGDVLSVDPCNTEKDACSVVSADASEIYGPLADNPDSRIEVRGNCATVSDGESIWKWSVFPVSF